MELSLRSHKAPYETEEKDWKESSVYYKNENSPL